MIKFGKLKPLALGCLLAGVAWTTSYTSAIAATTASSATQDENVLRATLDNGLRVVIVRDTLSAMVTTQITYLAGSYEAAAGYPGSAHALEHMLFRDAKGLTGA
ncbi:MAG: M16 family metallopeptidase, partial [Rhodanobacteraceae bacterium]